MANTDNNFVEMHQELKQLFPEIPDNIINNQAIQQYPDNLQKCIEILSRYKHRQAFLTNDPPKTYDSKTSFFRDVYKNQKQLLSPQLHSMERHDIRGHINGLSSPSNSDQSPVGLHGRWIPTTCSNTSGARSFSVSGVSPIAPSTTGSDFHSITTTTTAQKHPQSAPVMPSHYEPFHLEYHGLIGPSSGRVQMNVPPISDTSHVYSMRGESYINQQHVPRYDYNYEMRVQYTQVLQEQLAQKERLQHKLTGDKKKLEELKADITAMEKELEQCKEQRNKQNPLFSMYEEIRQLRDATLRLRNECHRMSKEVDELGEVPLGETSLDFYTNINPGQCGSVGVLPAHSDPSTMPPHSSTLQLPSTITNREQDDDQQWSCSACTFLNNGALNKCEMCDMPRFSPGRNYLKGTVSAQSKPCYCHQPITS